MAARLTALVLLGGAILACSAAAGSGTPPIVFAADLWPQRSGDVYRVDADGTTMNLTRSPFQDTGPAVSPSGTRVAFASDRSGGPGVYVVGTDGAGLRQLPSPGLGTQPRDLTWSPNGKALAVTSGVGKDRLSLLRPGLPGRVIARAETIREPAWSPSGRLITAAVGARTRAFTRAGKLVWSLPVSPSPGWSVRALFAGRAGTSIRVYDGRGQERFRFKGVRAAWSPNGQRIASLFHGSLEVRTSTGRLARRKKINGLLGGLIWADSRRVVVATASGVVGVDVVTGKTFRASERYFETRSPDGRSVVEMPPSGSEFALRVSKIDGSSPRVYGHVPGCYDDQAYSPALESLQFVRGRPSLVYQSACPEPFAALYAVAPDGSALTRLTDIEEQEIGPSWSPDGNHIAYTRYEYTGPSCKGCTGSLMLADGDASNPHTLTTPTEPSYADSSPSWSPDGTQILFTRLSFTQPGELFVVPANGGEPHDLNVAGSDSAWGPTRIAYVDFEHSPTALWTARPDGTDPKKVASGDGAAVPFGPAWSRDGRLAFIYGNSTVVMLTAAGPPQKVKLPFTLISSLAWSPDGSRFVVGAHAAGTASVDIYTVRTDGTDSVRLTRDMEAFSPSWR
jgi:Tol biopolymer transport system component